jgi:Ca2+-binding RTX toxin-like protein
MRNRLSSFLPLSCLMLLSVVACGTSTSSPVASDDPFQQAEENLSPLTAPCTFVVASGLMTVNVAAGETAIISRRAADSAILQNGASCDNLATSSTLKKLVVVGANGGSKTVILDFTNGLFGVGTSSTSTTGIDVSLGTSMGDTLGIRGTTAADNIAYGSLGVNLNNDTFKDISIAGAETHVVYLGDGADTFTAGGGTAIGTAFATALTVYGGAGADLFNQGSASTASETIYGGADTDTVSYALRTTAVTVTVGATGTGDGIALEADDIKSDVEIVTGGTAGDTMTAASGVAITFNGGLGNDTLIGDTANDTLNGDGGNDILRGSTGNDTLNGGDGNDTFDEEAATNGSDTFNGGNGTDKLDYSARGVGIKVTMDGTNADDGQLVGAVSEGDNCKADVEDIAGTTLADNITGNALNNIITGDLGVDTLNGGAGDDVFAAGAANDGLDTISGGTGVDTIDYSKRTGLVNVTLSPGVGSGEVGEGDLLATDMENVIGTDYNDVITGNASANELVGGLGDDTLTGLAGDDVLEGGGLAEENVLDCGAGDGDIGFGEGSGTNASRVNCEF